jgi:protein ImuB
MPLPKKPGLSRRLQSGPCDTRMQGIANDVVCAVEAKTKILWLCLHFPELPLEIYSRADVNDTPLAVSIGTNNRECVLLCNRPALRCGIQAGMTISAAFALAANLRIRQRNKAAEQEALTRIAVWAGQFTSRVNLVLPGSLVLEIGASLALFRGLENLLDRIKRELADLGYASRLGVAVTPLGATWLARAGVETPSANIRQLRVQLAPLPLRALDLDPKTLETLADLGLHCIGDCLRLPRDGLSRRFGPAFLRDFDCALGKVPDARQTFVPTPRFGSILLLPAPADNSEALLFAAQRLLAELAAFLRVRSGGILGLSLELRHASGAPTRLRLTLTTPSRDADYLRELLRARLERLKLHQAVEEIRLLTGHILPLPANDQDLFGSRDLPVGNDSEPGRTMTWLSRQSLALGRQHQLVERLRARLGNEAVRGICLVSEHRPERAHRACAPGGNDALDGLEIPPPAGDRPLWLLCEPLPLRIVRERPWLQGVLSLQAGPERVESGWWDGQDIARDYFVAENHKGARFWIYRERKTLQWFLHGIFA